MTPCGARHSDDPTRTCNVDASSNHPTHIAGYGRDQLTWPNEDFKPVVDRRLAESEKTKKLHEMAGNVEPNTKVGPPTFDGKTFDAKLDQARLGRQLQVVSALLGDGQWHTLAALSEATGEPEASISARIRDLRKAKFGSHDVEGRRVGTSGMWEYRLRLPVALRNFD